MADERTFKINITGDASGLLAAGQQAEASLKGIEDAGKQQGGAFEEISKQFADLNRKAEELKKTSVEVGEAGPGMAAGAAGILTTVAASITGAMVVFSYAKAALDEWNRQMDEVAARNASRDFLPGIEAKRTALVEGAVAAERFKESLAAIGAAEDEFGRKVAGAIGKLHEFMAAQAEISSAAEGKETAEVNLAEKLGKMTPEQAIVARAGIKERYRKQQEEAKTRAENEELALKEAELQHARSQAPELAAEAEAKRKAADELRAKQEAAKAQLPGAKKELARLDAEMTAKMTVSDEAGYKAGDVQRAGAAGQLGFGGQASISAAVAEAEKAKAEMEAVRAEYRRQLITVQRLEATQERASSELPTAEAGRRLAEEKATKTQQRIDVLEKELERLRETVPMRQSARDEASGLRSQASAAETMGALAGTKGGKQVVEAAATAQAMAAGKQVSDLQAMQLQALGQMLFGTQASQQKTISTLAQSTKNQESLVDVIMQLKARQEQLERRVGSLR
jgi:chromosome segregation ATPase